MHYTRDSVENWINVRKKPIVIQAFQISEASTVDSLEGTMKGKAGDFLIKNVNGEVYICDKEIFEKTYDIVAV